MKYLAGAIVFSTLFYVASRVGIEREKTKQLCLKNKELCQQLIKENK